MCRKCLEKMQDPQFSIDPANLDVVKTMVKIVQEDALKILHSILTFSEQQTGRPVNPAVIGLAWGWFYYASIYQGIKRGDFTLEQFTAFDSALKADTKQGVDEAFEVATGDLIFLADETDVPEELAKVLESLGYTPSFKPPGGVTH